jgi:SAM-dependent methyltransferase
VLSDLYGNTLAARRVSWLDIGCGYGEFLEALKATVGPGSTLKGSEPNKHKTSYARSRGLDVEYRELDQLREQFSHVSLLNVFSHLPEPIPFLSMARDLLEPGGELLLQTGNGGDVTRREFPGELWFPDHLTFAGRKTLELVVEKLQMQLLGIHAYRSPPLTPMNVAKDLVKRVIRKDYNPVDWRGPFRTLWLRARKA